MMVRLRPGRYLWLPLWLVLAALVFAAVMGFLHFSGAFPGTPKAWAGSAFLVGIPVVLLVLEAHVATRLSDGNIRVRHLFRTIEWPAAGTRIDVGWNSSSKFVLWVTPERKVRLASTMTTTRRAVRLARKTAAILEIPAQIDPRIMEAMGFGSGG